MAVAKAGLAISAHLLISPGCGATADWVRHVAGLIQLNEFPDQVGGLERKPHAEFPAF